MQASQSNNASDLLKRDARQNSPLHRRLPSPFSSPIQAARKYLERQRGEVGENGGGKSVLREACTERLEASPSSQDTSDLPAQSPDGPVETCRERERRLERSLYEGQSIEAGLSFDSVQADYNDDAAAMERAYLEDSDGTEPLYLYATPGPAATPDPEVVRGAIYRLARESQLRRESLRSPAVAASSPVTSAKSTPASSRAEAAEDAVPTLNFGDVARRVWAEGVGKAFEVLPEESDSKVANASGFEETTPKCHESLPLSPLRAASHSALKETETAAVSDTANAPVAHDAIAEEGAALAHDACNLLSALALYSELLASPGVLGEQHRHYAGELKLLAGRSQRLINRLHKVGATREAQTMRTLGAVPASSAEPAARISETALPTSDAKTLRDIQSDTASSTAGPTNHIPVRMDTLPVSAKSAYSSFPAEGKSPDAPANENDESTNLADLLTRWGGLLSVLAQGTLQVVIGPDAAQPIPARAETVERILVNLVRNARAATVDGGAIRIRVGASADVGSPHQPADLFGVDAADRRIDQRMVLTVDDSGCGMTEAEVGLIFSEETQVVDPRTVSTQEPVRRRGLGLQIVRELVAASHGTLSILSQPGRGTRIEVRWPILTSAVERARSLPSVVAGAPRLESPLEERKAPAGPDGFSDTDLRAMMLRMHRGSPHDRSPLSRRLWDRRPSGVKETDRCFGVSGVRSFHSNAGDIGQTDSVHNGSGPKGAIAC